MVISRLLYICSIPVVCIYNYIIIVLLFALLQRTLTVPSWLRFALPMAPRGGTGGVPGRLALLLLVALARATGEAGGSSSAPLKFLHPPGGAPENVTQGIHGSEEEEGGRYRDYEG